MVKNQSLIFGENAQSLVFDAPEGRPSSVEAFQTFYAYNADNSTEIPVLVQSTPSVDTDPNTALAAVAGHEEADPNSFRVLNDAGFEVGRQYLLTNQGGAKEWVKLQENCLGGFMRSAYPLQGTYQPNDPIVTTRITMPVLDSFVNDDTYVKEDADPNAEFRLRIQYTVDGVGYTHDAFFDLVRYTPDHSVTPATIEDELPGFIDSLPQSHQKDGGKQLIQAAYRKVKVDLHRYGYAIDAVRDNEILDEFVILKSKVLWLRARMYTGGSFLESVLQDAIDVYNGSMSGFVRDASAVKIQIDAAGDGSGTRVKGRSIRKL